MRSPSLDPGTADAIERVEPNQSGFWPKAGGYLAFKGVDFTDVKQIEIGATAGGRDGFPGGVVEVRTGSRSGPLLGQVQIQPAAPPAPRAGGVGGARGAAAIPGVTPAQQTAITAMDTSLGTADTAVTQTRSALVIAAFAEPRDPAAVQAGVNKLRDAEAAAANARSQAFAALQTSTDRLNEQQVGALRQQTMITVGIIPAAAAGRGGGAGGGGGRGGGARGGATPGIRADLRETSGKQDLYFVFRNDAARPTETIMSLTTIRLHTEAPEVAPAP